IPEAGGDVTGGRAAGVAVGGERRAVLAAADVRTLLGPDDAEAIVLAVRKRLDGVFVVRRDPQERAADAQPDGAVAGFAVAVERRPQLVRDERHVVAGIGLVRRPLVGQPVVRILADTDERRAPAVRDPMVAALLHEAGDRLALERAEERVDVEPGAEEAPGREVARPVHADVLTIVPAAVLALDEDVGRLTGDGAVLATDVDVGVDREDRKRLTEEPRVVGIGCRARNYFRRAIGVEV